MIRYIFVGLLLATLLGLLVFLICWEILNHFNCDFDKIRDIRKTKYCTVPMKFNHWRDMYYLNPERWSLSGALPVIWASYKEDNGRVHGMTNIYVNFKGIDAIRYSVFVHNMEKNKKMKCKRRTKEQQLLLFYRLWNTKSKKLKSNLRKKSNSLLNRQKKLKINSLRYVTTIWKNIAIGK